MTPFDAIRAVLDKHGSPAPDAAIRDAIANIPFDMIADKCALIDLLTSCVEILLEDYPQP